MERRSVETIAAIATAPGRGAIGVVRVSGTRALGVLTGLTGALIPPRTAVLARFRDRDGRTIDQGLTLYFAGPHSYTGEDLVEFQAHGGTVVLEALLQRCMELGARLAQPGEFTERAFLAGKIDLAQAEAVADLIDASSRGAMRAAARSLTGEFSTAIQALSQELRGVRVLLEAAIDFPEEDIDVVARYDLLTRLDKVREQLENVIERARLGHILRDGLQVAIAGEPNVGKSSLLNRLVGDDIAIVTDVPGTTRDAIRTTLEIEGIPVHITDTAGLRETEEAVESLGIERALAVLRKADLVLIVIDARNETEASVDEVMRWTTLPESVLIVRNKIDLVGEDPSDCMVRGRRVVSLSARAGVGLDMLARALVEMGGWRAELSEGVFMARSRHLEALQGALIHVYNGVDDRGLGVEVVAEELRYAEASLDVITGQRSSDELLGDIFSRFCIGK